jgi:hypothetical protein
MRKAMTHDRSWQTADRGPPEADGSPFLTVEKLGPKRELMKNGWLVCYDVPVARTGWMSYMPGEVPVVPNPTATAIYVERTDDELFNPMTVASFVGVGLVNGHPDPDKHPDGVTSKNAQELVGGYLTNVRRGRSEDGEGEVLVGDIVVTRQDFIDAIESGKREISAGYEAGYTTVRPGIGRQQEIVVNHIALVGKGRCGPRCAIGDHESNQQEKSMPQANAGATKTRRQLSAEELDGFQAIIDKQRAITADSADDSEVHVHVHMPDASPRAATGDCMTDDKDGDDKYDSLKKTVDALGEKMDAMMAAGGKKTKDGEGPDADMDDKGEGGTADKKTKDGDTEGRKTSDSAPLAASYQEVVSKAEILVPGFKVPTFDAAPRAMTVDAMCSMRRKVLDQYVATEDGKAAIAAMTSDVARRRWTAPRSPWSSTPQPPPRPPLTTRAPPSDSQSVPVTQRDAGAARCHGAAQRRQSQLLVDNVRASRT